MNRREFLRVVVGGLAGGATGLVLAAVSLASDSLDTRPENMHRDFAQCHCCGAKTFEYHKPDGPRAAVPAREDQFYESLRDRLIEIAKRTGKSVERLIIEPEYQGFRFARAWVEGESAPYTWNHPC